MISKGFALAVLGFCTLGILFIVYYPSLKNASFLDRIEKRRSRQQEDESIDSVLEKIIQQRKDFALVEHPLIKAMNIFLSISLTTFLLFDFVKSIEKPNFLSDLIVETIIYRDVFKLIIFFIICVIFSMPFYLLINPLIFCGFFVFFSSQSYSSLFKHMFYDFFWHDDDCLYSLFNLIVINYSSFIIALRFLLYSNYVDFEAVPVSPMNNGNARNAGDARSNIHQLSDYRRDYRFNRRNNPFRNNRNNQNGGFLKKIFNFFKKRSGQRVGGHGGPRSMFNIPGNHNNNNNNDDQLNQNENNKN